MKAMVLHQPSLIESNPIRLTVLSAPTPGFAEILIKVELAFIEQYCEMPDDVVFTVEYSVRSAQTAVYSLLGIPKEVSPLYQGQHDVGVLLQAMETMFH